MNETASNVIPLHQHDDDGATEIMYNFAEMVKNGEIEDFIVVATHKDGSIHTGSNYKERLMLIGALEYAKSRMGALEN